MNKTIKTCAHKIFALINSRYKILHMADENNKIVLNPDDAVIFNFIFSSNDHAIGSVLISLTENAVSVFFDKKMTIFKRTHAKREWYDLLRSVRQIAMISAMIFNCNDITSSFTSVVTETLSYNKKLLIMCEKTKIKRIFLEIEEGAIHRYLMPTNDIKICRVLANSWDYEKTFNTKFAKHILEMLYENDRLRVSLTETNSTILNKQINSNVAFVDRLRFGDMFDAYYDAFVNIETLQDAIVLESKRKQIMTSILQENYNLSAYSKKLLRLYEVHVLQSNTHVLDDDEIEELQEIMSKPLLGGIDGIDGISVANRFFNNSELARSIYDASVGSSQVDVRPIIQTWIKTHLPALSKIVDDNMDYADEHDEHDEHDDK